MFIRLTQSWQAVDWQYSPTRSQHFYQLTLLGSFYFPPGICNGSFYLTIQFTDTWLIIATLGRHKSPFCMAFLWLDLCLANKSPY